MGPCGFEKPHELEPKRLRVLSGSSCMRVGLGGGSSARLHEAYYYQRAPRLKSFVLCQERRLKPRSTPRAAARTACKAVHGVACTQATEVLSKILQSMHVLHACAHIYMHTLFLHEGNKGEWLGHLLHECARGPPLPPVQTGPRRSAKLRFIKGSIS